MALSYKFIKSAAVATAGALVLLTCTVSAHAQSLLRDTEIESTLEDFTTPIPIRPTNSKALSHTKLDILLMGVLLEAITAIEALMGLC